MFKFFLYLCSAIFLLPSIPLFLITAFSEDDLSDICVLSEVRSEFGENSEQYIECLEALTHAKFFQPTVFVISCIGLLAGLFFLYCARRIARNKIAKGDE